MMRNALLSLFIALIAIVDLSAQTDSTEVLVTIRGTAIDRSKPSSFLYLMVVNQRTSRGSFGDPYGGFEIQARQSDTILVSARGYEVYKLCLASEPFQTSYKVEIPVERLSVDLKEVEVFPEREIEEIEQDILELGAELKELEPMRGADAFQSPITALYSRFSKIEKSKRLVAEMELEDKKRELLKELFRKYIRHDIIDLSSSEFDDFISYMNLPTHFIKAASQYDLIMAIKFRYEQYRRLRGPKG